MKVPVPRAPWLRWTLAAAAVGVLAVALWLRGPAMFHGIADAFAAVRWQWVVAAIGLNLLSVVARSLAWRTVINQAMPEPHPSYPLVFSAFSIGLFANAVLPGRIGELARVAVLTRKLDSERGRWATLVGTVFAHRVFDLVPVLLLVVYVLVTAKIPRWAYTSLLVVVAVGGALFLFALVSARRHHRAPLDGLGPVKRILTLGRHGLGIMRAPLAATLAIVFQVVGWSCQLFAVWTAMRAFDVHAPLPAAGLVLVLMNVATVFPLWPGNVGLVQAAVALPLVQYGVGYAHGVAYGFGLQAIEASVGIGVGLVFLAREGVTFAMLKVMPAPTEPEAAEPHVPARESERERARIAG